MWTDTRTAKATPNGVGSETEERGDVDTTDSGSGLNRNSGPLTGTNGSEQHVNGGSDGTALLGDSGTVSLLPAVSAGGGNGSSVSPHGLRLAEPDTEPVVHASGQVTSDDDGTLAAPFPSTSLDVEALRESMQLAEEKLDELGAEFYSQLFARSPQLRDLFPAGMQSQQSRLVGALVRIVGSVDDSAELVSYLKGLGRDHRKFGVITNHYASVGAALVLALRRVLGKAWTPRHESAWIETYDSISKVMVEAANEDAVLSPPWWDAEVVFHRRVLDDVAVIQVRPHTDYPYRPGQYCWLATPRRPNMWRAYSMAATQRDDNLLEFHIRAVGAGWVSSALVWRTEAGDVLRLGAPQGHDLANPRSERDLLCICAGTGIAPVLSGLQELEQRQDGRRVHVFYAGRDRDRLYALPHLESIGVRYRRLTVVPVVSPEGPEDRSPDVMGNVVASYGDWRRHHIYVAGPSNMVQTTVDRLRDQGIDENQLVFDDYGIS